MQQLIRLSFPVTLFLVLFVSFSNAQPLAFNNATRQPVSLTAVNTDNDFHENTSVSHPLGNTSGTCVPGTINRFSGSYHSNLYIGNSSGTNVLLAWGQVMLDYTGTGTGNITTPTVVSSASYAGTPLEVRSSSSGGAAGLSALVLRTSTNLYFFGTAANLTAITSMASFGGIAINTAASNVTAKLPAGVLITDIVQVAISQTAFAIVTNTGHVYVLTKVLNLQGDKAVAGPAVWHHVTLSDGTTYLSGVTKLSLSSSGAFALTGSGNLYYWGSPANVAGVANTTTSYNYAYDMTAQIPVGRSVTDLVCLGTKVPSSSTLFILCDNQKVYGSGLNTNGCLGINNATTTFNAATFTTVKTTDGVTDLTNIVKIDGDTEADIFCMGAMTSTGELYGWGDSPAGMLGVNAATGSFAVPKTVQLLVSPAPATGFSDFSIAGHFTLAFFSNGTSDQYWYLGHNTGGSIGDPANVTTYILTATPASLNASGGISFDCSNAIPSINTSGTLSTFTGCSGTASSTQTIHVSGDNLLGNISITAPSGYELAKALAGPYSAAVTLTPTGGTVSDTLIYVRLSSTATNGASGNISCNSSSAAVKTFATGSATIDPAGIGGSIAGSTTVSSGTNSTALTLSGQVGSITKWQSSLLPDFSASVTDITNSTTNYTATDLTATTYFRAVITSGVCVPVYSSVATITVTGTLPITWLQFNAEKKEGRVVLSWSTASEQNSRDFIVQQSINSFNWSDLATITAAGNSTSENKYSSTDFAPAKGINYYRIMQRDLDGHSSFSRIVSVFFNNNSKQLVIYPNRVSGWNLNLQLAATAVVSIYNSTGQLILQRELPAGSQTLAVGQFEKGVYLLKAGNETVKFLIE